MYNKFISFIVIFSALTIFLLSFQNCGEGFSANSFDGLGLSSNISIDEGFVAPIDSFEPVELIVPDLVVLNLPIYECSIPKESVENLSESCLWTFMKEKEDHKNIFKYEPKYPLLFDGFNNKERYVYFPEGKTINNTTVGKWEFPLGTIFIKEFKYKNTAGETIKVETRLLEKVSDGYGLSHWRPSMYQLSLIHI